MAWLQGEEAADMTGLKPSSKPVSVMMTKQSMW